MVSTRQQATKAAAALGLAAACICGNTAVSDAFYTQPTGSTSRGGVNPPLAFAPPHQRQPWSVRPLAGPRTTASMKPVGHGGRRYVRERGGLETEGGLGCVGPAASSVGAACGRSRDRSSGKSRSRRSTKLSMVPVDDADSTSSAAVSHLGASVSVVSGIVVFISAQRQTLRSSEGRLQVSWIYYKLIS